MRYQDLVESVRDQAELDTSERARESVTAVLATVAHCVTPDMRARMAERLPGSLESAAEVPGETEIRDGDALLIEIGRRIDDTPERARYVGQAVFTALRAGDPDLVDELRGELHSDLMERLEPAAEPPGRARSVDPQVPTQLSDADIERALRRLTDWTGDENGLHRTVALPEDRLTPLINRVQAEARDVNDHVRVDRAGDSVTFTLSTGRRGAVTEPDVDLAERIDHVVAEVGSGGKPGR